MLHTVAHICLYLALVVHPCDTELVYAVGDAETLYEVNLLEFWMLVVFLLDSSEDLFYCLVILRLIGEATLKVC